MEGQKHYPSDVLAGATLGRFQTAFILNFPENGDVDFAVFGVDGCMGVELVFHF